MKLIVLATVHLSVKYSIEQRVLSTTSSNGITRAKRLDGIDNCFDGSSKVAQALSCKIFAILHLDFKTTT
jgi:hypothetical protein